MLPFYFAAFLSASAEVDLPRWVQERNGTVETEAGRITAVKLDYAWVSDADLDRLANLTTLRKLDLSLSLVTDAGIERLKRLENVTEFDLTSVELITDTAISYLRGWKKLERLNLRGTDITDTSIEHISGLTALKYLDISRLSSL